MLGAVSFQPHDNTEYSYDTYSSCGGILVFIRFDYVFSTSTTRTRGNYSGVPTAIRGNRFTSCVRDGSVLDCYHHHCCCCTTAAAILLVEYEHLRISKSRSLSNRARILRYLLLFQRQIFSSENIEYYCINARESGIAFTACVYEEDPTDIVVTTTTACDSDTQRASPRGLEVVPFQPSATFIF